MSKFYVLEPEEGIKFGRKWAYADILEPSITGDYQKCPICGRAVSQLKWLPPHRIKLSSAKPGKWGDFLWGAGFPLLVSDRFKDSYDQEGLSGITEFSSPVEIVRMGKAKSGQFPNPSPTYYLIDICWGGANQDDAASGLTYERPELIDCAFCRGRVGITWRKQERVVIEEGTWDGSDIFKPRNSPVGFMISERFKQVVEKHQLTNIWMIPAEQYGYDERWPGLWFVNI